MTEKRFRHMKNRLGMQFIGYDEKYVLLGTFADAEGVKYIVDLLNQLNDENEQLKDDVYNEIDNALTVLKELYEVIPLNSQKKMNQLY